MTEHHTANVQLSGAGNAPAEEEDVPEFSVEVGTEFFESLSDEIHNFAQKLDEVRAKYRLPEFVMAGVLSNFVVPVGDFYQAYLTDRDNKQETES